MNEINRAITTAQRRLVIGQFFSILTWATFASLVLATIGVAVGKLCYLEFLQSPDQRDAWVYAWILGPIVVGFVVAAALTWIKGKPRMEAATEVDHRFRLKERLSSAISLPPEDAQAEVGQALIADAARHAEAIEVSEKFELRPRLTGLLPLIPIAILSLLLLVVPDAQKPVAAASNPLADKEEAKLKVAAFKKRLEQTRQQIDIKGLKDASEDVQAIAKKFDQLNSKNINSQKDALVKINDIKKEIEDRKKSVGDSKKFRENLNRLKDVGKGAVKKVADALADGKFDDANKAIQDLAKKLRDGKLSKAEAKKIAKDLKDVAEKISQATKQRQKKMEDLQQQINKAVQNGDLDQAAKLQQQLESEKQNEAQQRQLQKLANQLQDAAQQMQDGQGDAEQLKQAMQDAAEALDEMGGDLQQLQQQMQDMEDLQDLEQMIDQLKQPGQGDCECEGEGDCPGPGGGGKGNGKGDGPGGEGRGLGARPFEEDETGGFKSRVAGKVGKGEKVITGNADGNNISGRSSAEVAELIRASESKSSDPTENQKLSKKHREHAQQYFKALRDQ